MNAPHKIQDLLKLHQEKKLLAQERAEYMGPGVVFAVKAKARALALADHLLDAQGKLYLLQETRSLLEQEGYIIEEEGYGEGEITRFFLLRLQQLIEKPSLRALFSTFTLPLSNTKVEEWIKILLRVDKLFLDRQVVLAVLSALLTPLRQSVGSCFGTAPAILVHEELPELFLSDMQSLCYKGQIKRTFGGIEFAVPMSPTAGFGELEQWFFPHSGMMDYALERASLSQEPSIRATFLEILKEEMLQKWALQPEDLVSRPFMKKERIEEMEEAYQRAVARFASCSDHLLLKVWEFTLASFTDVKTEFSRWNFFVSLGLHQQETGGIGEHIFAHLQKSLDEANEKIASLQKEYELAFDQVRAVESLLRNARGRSDMAYLEIEHRSRLAHFYSCEKLRDEWNVHTHKLAKFPSSFIERLIEKFPVYFQEIYDSQTRVPRRELSDIAQEDVFEDTPGGFRLLYKHGRDNPAAWTFIYTKQEYVAALRNFFTSIEPFLWQEYESKEEKELVTELISLITHWIQEDAFLISAFERLNGIQGKKEKSSLQELELLPKKPWSYLSGGTLFTLLKTYFRREREFSVEKKRVESSAELFVFILDTLKGLPPKTMDLFLENPQKRMLMISPMHVFSLLPGLSGMRAGWENSHFTYTWVRDFVIQPGQAFYQKMTLNYKEQLYLLQKLCHKIPLLEALNFEREFRITEQEIPLAEWIRELFCHFPLKFKDELEGFLFEMLPLSTQEKRAPLFEMFSIKEEGAFSYMGRKELHDLLIHRVKGVSDRDFHQEIATAMRQCGLASPTSFLFADTNWPLAYFAFIVSPLSLELSLWRTDRIGLCGKPMNALWRETMSPDTQEAWTILTDPLEYSERPGTRVETAKVFWR